MSRKDNMKKGSGNAARQSQRKDGKEKANRPDAQSEGQENTSGSDSLIQEGNILQHKRRYRPGLEEDVGGGWELQQQDDEQHNGIHQNGAALELTGDHALRYADASNNPNQELEQQEQPNEQQGNNDKDSDDDDDFAIEDAYLVTSSETGRNQRQRNKRTPELLDGVVETESTAQPVKTKWLHIGLLLLVLVATAAIALIVVLRENKVEEESVGLPLNNEDNESIIRIPTTVYPSTLTTLNPSAPPSARTSAIPTSSLAPTSERLTSILDEIRLQFHSPTLEKDLQSVSSPQYKAARWMAEVDVSDFTLGLGFPIDVTDHRTIIQFRQRYSLAVFYYSTNGDDSWLEKCNFMNPTKHVCEWNCPWPIENNPLVAGYVEQGFAINDMMGVVCFESFFFGSSVLVVSIVFNKLSGYLPDEVQGLDNMMVWDLNGNNIQGTIPFRAFNDTFLHQEYDLAPLFGLVLTNNQFTGSISDEIMGLTDLSDLHLDSNLLTGTIPSSMGFPKSQYRHILMDDNILSGTVPPSLLQIESLENLILGANTLIGTLPDDIRLPLLRSLALYENFISGTIPDAVGGLTSIQNLLMQQNELTGTILPSSLQQLTALRILQLYSNQLTGEGLNLSIIGTMTDLLELDISNNHISGTISTRIGELNQLTALSIHHSDEFEARSFITGTLPTEIGQLLSLNWLNVYRNGLVGTLPTEIGNLQLLQFASFSHNQFSGIIPTEMDNLRNLGTLGVHNTNLSGNLTVLCNNLGETDLNYRFGFVSDCLTEEVICECCLVCCDRAGNCEDNKFR